MNILLIDDNISTLAILKNALNWQELGIDDVFTAESADEARLIIDHQKIDILLCDIEMPGTDGLTFLETLRRQGNNAVCLFLTAHAEFAYAKRAIEVNSIDYILKPFSIEEVSEKLRAAVSLVRQQAENSGYIRLGRLWAENHRSEFPYSAFDAAVPPKEHPGVADAKRFIRNHYTENITLQDIADHVHHNASYLSKVFKQYEAVSPLDYLAKVRIDQSKLLLANPAFSIGEIALMVGFQNISYFNRVFKHFVKVTPSVYRAKIMADDPSANRLPK